MAKPFSPADIPGLQLWWEQREIDGQTAYVVHKGNPDGTLPNRQTTIVYDRVLTVEERLAVQRYLESLP